MSKDLMSFTSMIKNLHSFDTEGISLLLSDLCVSPFQPRKNIDKSELEGLIKSIELNGLINPITVRPLENQVTKFEIVAGERRYRAFIALGRETIPVNIKRLTDKEAHAIAIVENLQRKDLNPIEEAMSYKDLIDKHNLKHDQVAEIVGKSRTTVTNALRLLELNDSTKTSLEIGEISVGHAKVLIPLPELEQIFWTQKIVTKKLSVRQLETAIKKPITNKALIAEPVVQQFYTSAEDQLYKIFGVEFSIELSFSSINKIICNDEKIIKQLLKLLSKN